MEQQRPVHPMEELAGFTYVMSPPDQQLETVGFTEAAVQSIVGAPAQSDTDISTVLLLMHGTGGDEYDLLDLGAYIAPSALLISPRGRAPENGMNRWFARHAAGVLDEEDIRRRAEELSQFLPLVRERQGLRHQKIWLVGYSNGANMAAAMLLLYPDIADGAVLLRPMLPLTPTSRPDLTDKPVYIAAGRRDTMIPGESTKELIDLLNKSGADLTARFSDEGHQFTMDEINELRNWIAGYISAV